ncbi:MAG: polysaccharide biosynthesis/export family protein [Candidatus Competibacteraceae bacterium]
MMHSTRLLLILCLSLGLGGGCATNNNSFLPNGQVETVHTGERADTETTPATEQHSAQANFSTAQALPVSVTRASAASPGQGGRGNSDYRIGPEDLLDIQVFSVSELSRTVRVSSRGFISLPLLGEVKVAGLTSSELENRLAELLAKDYLQNPQISVFIKEYTSQRVTVSGAVAKPGVYPLKGRTTLLQAIAVAGGLDDKASPSDQVTVFRSLAGGTKQTLDFNLKEIRNNEKSDPLVQNDDIITVRTNTTVYVIREVTNMVRGLIAPYPLWGQ